jgi:polysaccharide export outer membrane protein
MSIKLIPVSLTIIFYLLLNGCSTTTSTSKDVEDTVSPATEETPKGIEVKEFILGPGDQIEIFVYRHDDLKRTVQIDTSGKITYPLIGDVRAGGLSIFMLRDIIRDRLSKYVIDPQVSVSVVSVQSQKVIVLGEVRNPGFFTFSNSMSILEAISRSQGFTLDAKQESVLLIRGGLNEPELFVLDLKDTLHKGDLSQVVNLQSGDIIYVPTTYIANVSRYFAHLSKIISPMVSAVSGYYIGQRIEGERGEGAAISTR